ncbi:hypothetical protein GA0074692_1381 [Micromonospora pallida]|uniref:Uncharacterized protein n=2 Tax=Micromonospora pallida TaxID=145854 RepID=A0A1C6RZA6_9ACTN|nr:hypothetical protein GA0074692_1381 [Micromonospora pallida]
MTTPATASRPIDADALVSLERKAAYEIPTRNQEVIADGAVVFKNSSDTAIRIKQVEPVLGSGGNGLEVVGTKIAPLRNASDERVGIRRQFPPSRSVADRWQDAVGAMIEPESAASAYELIIGFSVQTGTHRITAIRIEFEADGLVFHTDLSHDLTLCRMATPSSTAC